jgi:hypothetical protein
MVNITDIYELKAKLNKLKHQLNKESKSYQEKELANKYLDKVFDYLDELKLF